MRGGDIWLFCLLLFCAGQDGAVGLGFAAVWVGEGVQTGLRNGVGIFYGVVIFVVFHVPLGGGWGFCGGCWPVGGVVFLGDETIL